MVRLQQATLKLPSAGRVPAKVNAGGPIMPQMLLLLLMMVMVVVGSCW